MGLFKHHKKDDESVSTSTSERATRDATSSLAEDVQNIQIQTHTTDTAHVNVASAATVQVQAASESLVTSAQVMEAAKEMEPEKVNQVVGKTETITKVKEPIIQLQVKPRIHEEITPVVERVREEMTVHQIIQPIIDKQHTVTHEETTKDSINNQVVEPITAAYTEKYQQNSTAMVAYEQVAEVLRTQSMKGSIITETINKHTIFEVQPVIQREIDQEVIRHTIQPIFEKWVSAPKVMELAIARPVTVEDYVVMKETIVGEELIKRTEIHTIETRGLVEE